MYQLIMILHVIAAVCLVLLVLVQQGKGSMMGSAFGSGASQTVFGSRGSGSFLLKLTIMFVVIFFSTSIALNYMATKMTKHQESLSGISAKLQHGSTTNVPPPVSPSSIPANATPATTAPVTPNSIPALPVETKEKK